MRVVKVKVYNAGVPDTRRIRKKNGKMEKDSHQYTVDKFGRRVKSLTDLDNLVCICHISNMLHVLMGDRPVSSKGLGMRKRSEYLDDIASNALFKFDTAPTYTYWDKDGNEHEEFITRNFQGRKIFINSNRNEPLKASNGEKIADDITWRQCNKRAINTHEYHDAMRVLEEMGKEIGCNNIRTQYTLVDFLIMMRDYPEWVAKLRAIKNITPLIKVIDGTADKNTGFTSCGKHNYAGLSVIKTCQRMVVFDATIIFFMNDEDAENVVNGAQIASLLEGCANVCGDPISVKDFEYVAPSEIENLKKDYVDDGFLEVKNFPLIPSTISLPMFSPYPIEKI